MSLDYSAPDLSGYSGPQEFVDSCSFPDLADSDDVWPTRTIHGSSTDRAIHLDPTQRCAVSGDEVGLKHARGARILIADAALANVLAIRVQEEPTSSRRGILVANQIEGLDSDVPAVISSREVVVNPGKLIEVSLNPRGILKVVASTWRREAGVREHLSGLDERQWQEYLLASKVRAVLMTSGK